LPELNKLLALKGLLKKNIIPFIILLMFAGIFAITQELPVTDESSGASVPMLSNDLPYNYQEDAEESPSDWIILDPPRWFRSNAGGMALEETPSRLAALRNKYALVIDHVLPAELDSRLLQFYQSGYTVEVRVLFEQGTESRKQWLLRDTSSNVRLNAVYRKQDEPGIDSENTDTPVNSETESVGFIEVFNEHGRITGDYWLYKNGGETLTEYFYNDNMLVNAVTQTKDADDANGEYRKIYTDNYRYNRSFSLRRVERLYHGLVEAEPIYLLFPSRILDAVSDADFIKEKLTPDSEFLGSVFADDGYRIIYDTDSRGRILTQTMTNEDGETVWVTKNTWSGDRIISILKIESDEEKLTEYEYDSEGKRVVQRDIHNGILERIVYIKGENETEELFMDGVVVLRAYWENGRKILEERVRH
jgi:YD repeat-containing protein